MKKLKILAALAFCVALIVIFVMIIKNLSFSKPEGEPETETYSQQSAATVTVTIPEGTPCIEIAELLEEKGVCSKQEFLDAVANPENKAKIPGVIENDSERPYLLEGYIFPDTYEFYAGCSGQAALDRFLENADRKINRDDYRERADELGLTMDEVIIIASIIQEEAGNPANMKGVSSVIHNRLNSRDFPRLQCDVAVAYLQKYVKPYYDRETYSVYCDYYNIVTDRKGLPAGAISNPGTDAIEAALYPDDTDYYYFVTDEDENYYYAETWSEHKANCRKAGIPGY